MLKFPYGSRVYGTHHIHSDYDWIIVGNMDVIPDESTHVYTPEEFQLKLDKHDISCIEAFFTKENPYQFILDKAILRSEISAKASNSFVKAKKKIEVEQDYYIGKKSLWHSLRILMFGKQIATFGGIVDFSEANPYYDDIMAMPDEPNWLPYKEKYQPIYNKLSTEFRSVAPKK